MFIMLESLNNGNIYVNADHITSFSKTNAGNTCITMKNNAVFYVKETPKQIVNKTMEVR